MGSSSFFGLRRTKNPSPIFHLRSEDCVEDRHWPRVVIFGPTRRSKMGGLFGSSKRKTPGPALDEKGFQREISVGTWVSRQERRAAVVPRKSRSSTARCVPPVVYIRFRLFVLPKRFSGQLFSKSGVKNGRLFSRRIDPLASRSALARPPCLAASSSAVRRPPRPPVICPSFGFDASKSEGSFFAKKYRRKRDSAEMGGIRIFKMKELGAKIWSKIAIGSVVGIRGRRIKIDEFFVLRGRTSKIEDGRRSSFFGPNIKDRRALRSSVPNIEDDRIFSRQRRVVFEGGGGDCRCVPASGALSWSMRRCPCHGLPEECWRIGRLGVMDEPHRSVPPLMQVLLSEFVSGFAPAPAPASLQLCCLFEIEKTFRSWNPYILCWDFDS